MYPNQGDTVIYRHTHPVNGSFEHPAIVTAVFSEDCVNLRVLFDADPRRHAQSEWLTSVPRASTVDHLYTGGVWLWFERAEPIPPEPKGKKAKGNPAA